MDTSNLVAAWLSFGATAVGLGGLITQASAINEKMDPFHASRTREYLGIWFQRQAAFPWWKIAKPPPQGPIVAAKLSDGFCGVHTIHLARIPPIDPGQAGWSIILAMLNAEMPPPLPAPPAGIHEIEKATLRSSEDNGQDGYERNASWAFLPRRQLTRHQSRACISISRTTLLTMLAITNARPVFQYSDVAGFRGGYASYMGQWYITWPIGQEAIVTFAAHDSIGKSEVFPRSFALRVSRCGEMLSGIVSGPAAGLKVAFCGRKAKGTYQLVHDVKGFQGAHGARHLYNLLGGKAYEVDFMFAKVISDHDRLDPTHHVLHLPSKDGTGEVKMAIPPHEESVIREALDCLPWTSLSWSIHRGLRDILVAYAKPVMNTYRRELAERLKKTVEEYPEVFRARGWDPTFVRNNMGHMATSAILAGSGNSGDSVRVVTDIVTVMVGQWGIANLDEVRFWRRPEIHIWGRPETELDDQAIVALTKVFVLEWSIEFDYQMYHHLPISLYFG